MEPSPIKPAVIAKLNEIAKLKSFYLNGGWCDAYPTLKLIGSSMLAKC